MAAFTGIYCFNRDPIQLVTLPQHFADYDFFFVHIKGADAAGEDGDFERKVRIIEEVDVNLPGLINLKPDWLSGIFLPIAHEKEIAPKLFANLLDDGI